MPFLALEAPPSVKKKENSTDCGMAANKKVVIYKEGFWAMPITFKYRND